MLPSYKDRVWMGSGGGGSGIISNLDMIASDLSPSAWSNPPMQSVFVTHHHKMRHKSHRKTSEFNLEKEFYQEITWKPHYHI